MTSLISLCIEETWSDGLWSWRPAVVYLRLNYRHWHHFAFSWGRWGARVVIQLPWLKP